MSSPPADLDAIFCRAIELGSSEARAAYLAEACGADEPLRRQAESLVAAHFRAGSFLNAPAAASGPTAGWPAAEAPGAMVGPYKLLEQIGEGGMGVVYVAEQAQPVRRRVALKVIKPGMDTREVVARFEAERQALALMDHPNIARVIDAGATESGRPYFVMELVRGLPITEYCDRAGLAPADRLRLFAQVCRAVQHAHTKGVIHRDLKPSNVLVTLHDGAPVPKVIDFGVAKALNQPLTERSLYTRFAQMIGTPLYMSPEQAELSGLDVDTRSDVYSLGVLLYELLTGTTPFDGEMLRRAGLDEVRRIIREQEPPRPSTRLMTLGPAERSGVSGRRGLDDRRLSHLLRGDLDWVAMKALEKDRTRRYESAGSFAADVERYLADEPVEARPPSAWYRARKAARRNRVALLTSGLVAAALVGGTVVSAWQAVRATDARRQAEVDRDRAREAERQAAEEADVARAINTFLRVDLIGQADAVAQINRDHFTDPRLTVREALDRAAARIGERFRDRPLVEAGLRATIGNAYSALGNFRLAAPHLECAAELRAAHLGPDHPHTLSSSQALAGAYAALGRHPEAVALQRRVLDRLRAGLGPDHPDTLAAMDGLGAVLRAGGRFAEAVSLHEQTYAKRSAALGAGDPAALASAAQLARACYAVGEWDRALALQQEVLRRCAELSGPDHPDALGSAAAVAATLEALGRLPEAVELGERLLAKYEARIGPDHPSTVNCLHGLARKQQAAGRFDVADRLLRDAVARRKRHAGGEPDLMTAHTVALLGLNLLKQKKPAETEAVVREALALYDATYPDHWGRSNALSMLGESLSGQGRRGEAEPLLLGGYEGLKQREGTIVASVRRARTREAVERLVRFYDEAGDAARSGSWREKLPPPR